MFFGLLGGEKKRVAEMIAAARTGNIEKIKQLLSKGVDINAPEPESGDTPLLAAIDKSQWAAAEFLLQQRPNLNLEDKNGNTPLYLAVSRGDEAMALVNQLLDAGAQVDLGPMKGDNAGVTPLHIACATGANGCLEALLRRGASATKHISSGATPLHTAAIGGDKQTIDLLCKAGGDVTALNADKRTPLHNCGITGNANAAAALIQQGAVVDGADAEGCTPLMRAVMKNQVEVAKLLLSNGANPDVIVRTTDTPLYPLFVAAMSGYTELVRILLEEGANVMAKVEGVPAPLDAAKHNGHEAAAKLLSSAVRRHRAADKAANGPVKEIAALWKKIVPAVPSKDVDTLRKVAGSKHFSAMKPEAQLLVWVILGEVNQAKALLESGANPNETFDDLLDGISLLYIATGLTSNIDMVHCLLNADANPNLKWENGATPIFEALQDSQLDFLRLLIEKGADVNALMNDGKTPLIQSTLNNSRKCVDLLLDAGSDINYVLPSNGLGPFGVAVDRLKMDMALHLLSRGAKPEFGTTDTLGLAVAEYGSIELIRAIEKAGGSIIRPDQLSRVAFVGSRNKDCEVLDYLFNHGADIGKDNDCQYTPLIISVLRDHTELVRRYSERGDDLNVRDVDGETALSLAIEMNKPEMIYILCRNGAEVRNYPGLSQTEAMLQASRDGALGTILNLRDAGVSINIEDAEGNSPMILSAREGHLGVVRSLYHLGADINHKNRSGQSATTIAMALENKDILATMKEFVADDAVPEALKGMSLGGIHDLGDVMFGRTSHPGKGNPPYDSESEVDVDHDDDSTEESSESDNDQLEEYELDAEVVLNQLLELKELFGKPYIAAKFEADVIENIFNDIESIQSDGPSNAYSREIAGLLGLLKELRELPVEMDLSPLFQAASDGDLRQFKKLVKDGADIKQTLSDGTTLLMKAAEKGHDEIVLELIKLGVDVNQSKPDTFSAFLIACFMGNEDVVKTLAKHGADVNVRYEVGSSNGASGGLTALVIAAQKGHEELCSLLLKLGSNIDAVSDAGYTPLMASLVNGASEAVATLLLKAGANPDPDAESKIAISVSTTPLILASTNGMTAIVRALIKRNVVLDKVDGDGWTALKRAASEGHEEIVGLLLKAGASPNIADQEGWTALMNAAGKRQVEICKALLKAGAEVNAVSSQGTTALRQAIGARNDSKLVDVLKELKRMLSGGDDDELSDEESSLNLIKVLLKAGANANILQDGASLLSLAIENDDQELAKLLKKHGGAEVASQSGAEIESDNNPESEQGMAFIAAAAQADSKGLRDLVIAGVDVNYVSAKGQTALGFLLAGLFDESNDRMFRRNAEQCLDYLLSHGADPGLGEPSPFFLAAMGRRIHLVQAMLSAGVDINKTVGEGQTALFMSLLAPDAGQPNDDRCALALLKAGADSSLRHESGAMPIHLAAGSNYLGALQVLLEKRPQEVNAQTDIGITPLMMAATEGHAESVRMLLKFGADLALKDDEGLTAKDVAIKNGNKDLVPLLS